jgi:hypothetical protein
MYAKLHSCIAHNSVVRNTQKMFSGIVNHAHTQNTQSAKENMKMNTRNNVVRAALCLLPLCALMTLSHRSAKADVLITSIRDPYNAVGVTTKETDLQFLVANTNSYRVSSQQVSVQLTLQVGFAYIGLHLASSSFSLNSLEQKWISVSIPTSINSLTLEGRYFQGSASIAGHSYGLSFLDIPPASDVEISKITPPTSSTKGAPFSITVTNRGSATSGSEILEAVLYEYADGQVAPSYTRKTTVPALHPGESKTVTFYLGTTNGNETKGTVSIGTPGATDYHSEQVQF